MERRKFIGAIAALLGVGVAKAAGISGVTEFLGANIAGIDSKNLDRMIGNATRKYVKHPYAHIVLDNIEQHIVTLDAFDIQQYDSLHVAISDRDSSEVVGKCQIPNIEKFNSIVNRATSTFKFIPASVRIQVVGESQGVEQVIGETDYEHEIQKLVIVDRTGGKVEPERIYAIEGDSFNLFGRLVFWDSELSKISTGKGRGTPLGYHHARTKQKVGVNEGRGWTMPFVHWYFNRYILNKNGKLDHQPWNGIHEGFAGTPYGRIASHGCTRVQPSLIKAIYNWSDKDPDNSRIRMKRSQYSGPTGTPVIYIDKEYTTGYCKRDFDTADYPGYKIVLRELVADAEAIQAGNYSRTMFPGDWTEKLRNGQEAFAEILEACRVWRRAELNGFNELMQDTYAPLENLTFRQ